jgi:hypothetical protein
MKKHLFFTALLTIAAFFLSNAAQAQTTPVLPTEPFGTTGLSKPTIPCPSLLVGYVNFQYTGAGAIPNNWNINNIQCYGPATQTVTTNMTYAAGTVYNTNNYSIVKNPSTMGAFQNMNAPGGYFVTHSQAGTLVYTIRGLNSPMADFGTNGTTYPIPAGLIYYVRIKVHNFGTTGGCGQAGNNIEVTFDDPTGNSFNQGNQLFYDNNRNRGQNGRWMSSSPICTGNSQNNQSWGGWGQINNPVAYDGNTAVLEGCFAVGAGQAGYANNDGFRITIKGSGQQGDNIFGIESIEVYGCLPMKIEAADGLDPNVKGTNFCENGPVDITAIGAGFGGNIQWYKGEGATPPVSNPIGSGNIIHTTAPQGVGTSEKYWAVGSLGFDTVRIYSVFCCSALGATNVVFEEHFPLYAPSMNIDGAIISPLNPANGTTTYTYIVNNGQATNNGCHTALNYHLDEGEYAIVTHSHWCFWYSRTQVNEHTGTPNSGAMMINAGSDINQYFYTLNLTNLCPDTQYEFSAWYASVAMAGSEDPSNIEFQILQGATAASGTPVCPAESTGLFGGTANSANNSSYIWRKKTITFTTPASSTGATQYWLRLRNKENKTSGNDLLIDDIVVTKCIPTLYLYEAGTNNTSISVCSGNDIPLEVVLTPDMVNLISGGSGTVYVQLMSSTNGTTWTAVGIPQASTGGNVIFSVTPPASGTVYYRVKISSDPTRAANVNLSLTDGCYNDVITQTFDITRDGSLGNAADPTKTPHIICSTVVSYYDLTGITPADADAWGWVLHQNGIQSDTVGMTYSTTAAGKSITTPTTANGTLTYYFVYKKGDCRAYKTVTVTVFNDTQIQPITITQPAAVCEGEPLALITPTVTSTMPITGQGWLLNGQPLDPATPMTAADNGKVLTYFARNDCDSETSNQITLNVTAVVPEYDNAAVCNANFPYRYQNAAFAIDTTFDVGTVADDYVFTGYCKKLILTLDILNAVNSEQPQFPRVCADDGFFYIQIEPTGAAGDVPATDYTAEFSASSGITTPQTGAVETGNKIRIDIPANIYPDIYSCKIILENPASCSSKTFENVQFEVYYPSSVMQQKWDDVIALKNSYYNGGYDFTGYQWYKNGYPTGETRSYIYLGKDTLDQNAEYYVLLTRADGSTMYSCPLKPTAAKPTVSTHPTIVANDNLITIYLTKDNATARLWTTTGILLQTAKAKAPVREISFTARQGAYLVEVIDEDGTARIVETIVVSR